MLALVTIGLIASGLGRDIMQLVGDTVTVPPDTALVRRELAPSWTWAACFRHKRSFE